MIAAHTTGSPLMGRDSCARLACGLGDSQMNVRRSSTMHYHEVEIQENGWKWVDYGERWNDWRGRSEVVERAPASGQGWLGGREELGRPTIHSRPAREATLNSTANLLRV
jgi:hypothetical protein